jgi:hypothetical protein
MEHRIGWLSGGRGVESVRVGPAALSSPVPMQRVGRLAGGGHACQAGGPCGCGGACQQRSVPNSDRESDLTRPAVTRGSVPREVAALGIGKQQARSLSAIGPCGS